MNGKGSSPRNCFSKQFKQNYDSINWGRARTIDEVCGMPKGTFNKFVQEQREQEIARWAEMARRRASDYTPAQRQRLIERAMQIINTQTTA